VPLRSGFGAGTKDFVGRANALRIVLASAADAGGAAGAVVHEDVVQLAADIDDMTAEYLAAAADEIRVAGALDVVLLPTQMKKGRVGTRIEVLARPADAAELERLIFTRTSTIGVRISRVVRAALPREHVVVQVGEHRIRVKTSRTPRGTHRVKPEADDVLAVAAATGVEPEVIARKAADAARTAHDSNLGSAGATGR
jgi:hypothetical protein